MKDKARTKGLIRSAKMTWIAPAISGGFMVVVLLPLYWIAVYNYPSSDDFAYAGSIYWNLKNGAGIWTIFRGIWDTAVRYYLAWQGRYFDDLISAMGVGIAVPKYYFLGSFCTLTFFVAANLLLMRQILQKMLKWDGKTSWVIAFWVTAFQVLYVPYAVEAFYWYVGATGYTLTYSFMLMMIGNYLKILSAGERDSIWKDVVFVGILLFMLGGTNYGVALFTAEMLVLFWIATWIWGKGRRQKIVAVSMTGFYFLCFAANVFSPGNKARMGNVESLGLVGSILAAIKQACVFCREWFHLPVVLLLLFCCAMALPQLARSNRDWKLPGIVTLLSLGLMASLMAPPFYAGATWGPGRLINVVYYTYYGVLIGNAWYWLGWLIQKIPALREWILRGFPSKQGSPLIYVIGMGVFFLVALKINGLQSTSTSSALLSLLKGEAKTYQMENEQRWELLEDETREEVTLEEYSVKPHVLYHDDISTDPDDWRNYTVKEFFKKEQVRKA